MVDLLYYVSYRPGGGIVRWARSAPDRNALIRHPTISPNVHPRLDPLPTRTDSPRGVAVHRPVRAREPGPVLALDAARLDRDRAHGVVCAVLPRSRAGDAGPRWPGRGTRRRQGEPHHQRGAAAGAQPRRPPDGAGVDLHERVRLPREPQPD